MRRRPLAPEGSPLRDASARRTRQLEATRRALCATTEHPTAERLFHLVRVELPRVSRGTVYRNLQKLVASGDAIALKRVDRAARFDGRTEEHDHFVCIGCGAMLDVDPRRRVLPTAWAKERGCAVERIAVTYEGRCAACAAPRRRAARAAVARPR